MKKIIICLFLSAGLSGCHVYRTYERPDTTVTDSLTGSRLLRGIPLPLLPFHGRNYLAIRNCNN